jgi:hypothetical protein
MRLLLLPPRPHPLRIEYGRPADHRYLPTGNEHAQISFGLGRHCPVDFLPAQAAQITGSIIALDVLERQLVLGDASVYAPVPSVEVHPLLEGIVDR